MRRITLMLASTALTVLLASGVALAINTIQWKTNDICRGTAKRDLMKGTDGRNEMSGKGAGDVLKGFPGNDFLAGGPGNDLVVGGQGNDSIATDPGDDILKGGEGRDFYIFGDDGWGDDTIGDIAIPDNNVNTGNALQIYHDYDATFGEGNLTIDLNSDSGPVPELTNGADATNWSGNVIDNVYNEAYGTNDQIFGNDAANDIHSTSGADFDPGTDADTISAEGGNDRIFVRGDDGIDTVECGAGTDTVFFDEGEDVLVEPDDCENKNPLLR